MKLKLLIEDEVKGTRLYVDFPIDINAVQAYYLFDNHLVLIIGGNEYMTLYTEQQLQTIHNNIEKRTSYANFN